MTSSSSAAPLLVALLAFNVTPTVAHAQEVAASSLRELAMSLKTNEQLIVTDRDGRRVTGRFVEVTDSGLALNVTVTPGKVVFPETAVQNIAIRDSLLNGALIGLAVGIVPGAYLGGVGAAMCECVEDDELAGPMTRGAVVFGGLGALIGGLIDRAHNRVVYASPQRKTSLRLSPLPTARGLGASMSVRF